MTGCEHPLIVELGCLGGAWWGRCRQCGQDVRFNADEAPELPDPYDLILEALDA